MDIRYGKKKTSGCQIYHFYQSTLAFDVSDIFDQYKLMRILSPKSGRKWVRTVFGLLCVEYHDSVAAGEKGDGKGKPRARKTRNTSLK